MLKVGSGSMQVYCKTHIGYSHIRQSKRCQDYSSMYKDNERTIITCCDGHGGNIYIRSHFGSKFAALALYNVLINININQIRKMKETGDFHKLKLSILCEWNRLVEQHLGSYSFKKKELKNLNEEEIEDLINNPVRAYGTTLTGALVIKDLILMIGIGDTECLVSINNKLEKVFLDDQSVANITTSMCQENVYDSLQVAVYSVETIDGVFLCTDGLTSPYVSYSNLNDSLIQPIIEKSGTTHSLLFLEDFIKTLATKLGNGDDVSLACVIFKENNDEL